MNESNKTFLHFELETQAIAIGERIKGGVFRPCIETIPTSTLKGSFRDYFGLADASAIGFFREWTYEKVTFTYAPFDALELLNSLFFLSISNHQMAQKQL